MNYSRTFFISSLVAMMLGTSVGKAAEVSPSAIAITTDECPDVRASEIQRIVHIELASVVSQWRGSESLAVELSCNENDLRIAAIDPITSKRLSRDVTLAQDFKDRERTIALLVAQLFLTSWSELLLPQPASAPPPKVTPPPVLTRAAETITRQKLDISRPNVWNVSLALGPRMRQLSAPILSERAALRPEIQFGSPRESRAGAFVEVGYERGSADRASGSVGFTIASAALGVVWHSALGGPLTLNLGATAGGSYIDVRGEPVTGVIGGATSGATFDGALSLGPSVHVGPAHIGLEVQGGITAPRVTGRVARDQDVSLGGVWAGANLVLGLSEVGR